MKSIRIGKTITDRSNEAFAKYLKDISKIKLLSKEEENEVVAKMKSGDKAAEDLLITSNLRFVISVAKQYQGQGIPLNDLINEGNCGLIEAARRFDPDKGVKFISYAVWWIRQAILQAITYTSRTVRQPMNQIHNFNKITKAIKAFEDKNQRVPTTRELAEATGLDEDKIAEIQSLNKVTISFDSPIATDDDSNNSLLDITPNHEPDTDNELIKESNMYILYKALDKLKPREHDVLRLYYGIGVPAISMEEIGDMLGVTNERARQIKDAGLKSLRAKYTDPLKELLADL